MIDLSRIVSKIEERVAELGTTVAEISAKATDSKDTIRNWIRAVEGDQKNGTSKASATTIKLNQVEAVLGIELARNAIESDQTSPEAKLRSALLAFGVDASELGRAVRLIEGFLDDPDEPQRETPPRGRSELANHPRVKAPSK